MKGSRLATKKELDRKAKSAKKRIDRFAAKRMKV